jgi:hypothetical protein
MNEPTTENLRDAIASAMETSEAAPSSDAAPAAPAPAESVAAGESQFTLEVQETQAPAEGANADLNALAEKPDRARDEKGKFARAEQAPEITPGPKSGPKQQDRAPASWRPEVREHWGKLPPDVRAEVARREHEVQRTLQETSEARKVAEAYSRAFAPYEAYIRAENATPIQAIDNLMATAVKLRTGTGPELAQLVAGMVKQFGVGRFGQGFIEQLDSALAGQVPQVDQQQMQLQQAVQQQLAPVQQFMSQFQQAQAMQQQQLAHQASSEVESFLDKAEFGQDVRDEMADLMEVAQRRGREITLQDAYRQACLANPRVRSVLQQRAKAQQAQTGNSAAQRARAAAVSVSGAPALSAPGGQTPDSVRSAIEQAIALSGR